MKKIIAIDFCFDALSSLPIIDVRSPGEYHKGHIPKATNIPLFSDEERAIIGTAYKKESKEKAIELGYKFVNPKLALFISKSLDVAPKKEVVVHCWRGGMRSNAFADFLLEQGFRKVHVIEKGYKAYRNFIHQFFELPFQLKILGGYTGSGKTEILHCLAQVGQQVIDLEGLANHRGSAFGGIDLPPQPTTEQFENNLFTNMFELDIQKLIWMEDESNAIGSVNIPMGLYKQIRTSQIYFLNISQQERTKHLVKTYSDLSSSGLVESINKITKRLGLDKAKMALQELENKNYNAVVELVLMYYDKYYIKGLHKRDESTIIEVPLKDTNHQENANFLLNFKQKT